MKSIQRSKTIFIYSPRCRQFCSAWKSSTRLRNGYIPASFPHAHAVNKSRTSRHSILSSHKFSWHGRSGCIRQSNGLLPLPIGKQLENSTKISKKRGFIFFTHCYIVTTCRIGKQPDNTISNRTSTTIQAVTILSRSTALITVLLLPYWDFPRALLSSHDDKITKASENNYRDC